MLRRGWARAWMMLALAATAGGCRSSAPVRVPTPDPEIRTSSTLGDRSVPVVAGTSGGSREVSRDDSFQRADAKGRVSGRVVDRSGEPVEGAVVRLAADGRAGGRDIRSRTDRSGGFTLSGLAPGDPYTLIAELDDGRELWIGRARAYAPRSNVRIVVESGSRPIRKVSNSPERRLQYEDHVPRAPKRTAARATDPDEAPYLAQREADEGLEPIVEAPEITEEPATRRDGRWVAEDSRDRLASNASERDDAARDLPAEEPIDENPLPPARVRPNGRLSAAVEDTFESAGPVAEAEPVIDLPSGPPEPAPAVVEPEVEPPPMSERFAPGSSEEITLPPLDAVPSPESAIEAEPIKSAETTPAESAPVESPETAPETSAPAAEAPAAEAPAAEPAPVEPAPVADPGAIVPAPAEPAPAPAPESVQPEGDLEEPTFPTETPATPVEPATPVASEPEVPTSEATEPAAEAVPNVEPTPAAPPVETALPAASVPEVGVSAAGPEMQLGPDTAVAAETAVPAAELGAEPEAPTQTHADFDPLGQAHASPSPRITWGDLPLPERSGVKRISRVMNETSPAPRPVTAMPNFVQPAMPPGEATRRSLMPPTMVDSGLLATLEAFESTCRFDAKRQRLSEFALPDLNGQPFHLKDVGAEYVLIVAWGTWCQPALGLLPHLAELQDTAGTGRLQVVSIAYETGRFGQNASGVAAVSRRLGVNFPVLLGRSDESCPLRAALNIELFPTMILLDRHGKILWRDHGATPTNITRLDRAVAAALQRPVESEAR